MQNFALQHCWIFFPELSWRNHDSCARFLSQELYCAETIHIRPVSKFQETNISVRSDEDCNYMSFPTVSSLTWKVGDFGKERFVGSKGAFLRFIFCLYLKWKTHVHPPLCLHVPSLQSSNRSEANLKGRFSKDRVTPQFYSYPEIPLSRLLTIGSNFQCSLVRFFP